MTKVQVVGGNLGPHVEGVNASIKGDVSGPQIERGAPSVVGNGRLNYKEGNICPFFLINGTCHFEFETVETGANPKTEPERNHFLRTFYSYCKNAN